MAQLQLNGAAIAYDDRGAGRETFVFIHGWACNRSFWQPQFDDLSRDYRCVSIDLRGRGGSAPVPPYDTTTAADDVAEVIRKLSLGPSILVGHSLGGLVALLVNDRHPELVRGIVLGDSPLSGARSGFDRMVQALRTAGSMEPARTLVESFFVEDTPHDIREHVREVMLGCDPEVAAGMFENSGVLVERLDDMIRKADQKPLMAIWAERPLGDPDHMRDVTMFVRQEPIAGAGHFFQLEQPSITNALLRAFVDDVQRDPRLSAR